MKITKIELKDFHQFKDVEIDLTYPKGHKKEGDPLDKVCFIGQSGTGKTTLLKLISGYTFTKDSLLKEYSLENLDKVLISRQINELKYNVQLKENKENSGTVYHWINHNLSNLGITFIEGLNYKNEKLTEKNPHLIFFPADLKYDKEKSEINLSGKKVIDFSFDNVSNIWNTVFDAVQKYQEQELVFKQEIAKVAVDTADITKIQKSVTKLEKWQKKTPNPIIKLAEECLDPLLKIINLRVKKEFKFESKDDIGFVKIEDLNGNEVPFTLLSTGTKQILLSALPLYLLKPKGTLILYDEPERSLYPSLQKFIVDYYTSLTNDSQFFFATHSPLIASNFEPWEIVELKFNDKGFVEQELYYPKEMERHVDNYTIIPSYLNYDLILSKVFDLEESHSYERSEKLTEVLMLRNQFKKFKEKNELESAEAKKIYAEYRDLATKLFWDIDLV